LGIGGFVAHAGLAILMGGLIVSRGYERKDTILVRQNSPAQALDYLVNFQKLTDPDDLYDRNNKVIFDVTWPGGNHFEARPGMYMYGPQDDEPKTMVWPHIERSLSHDVYVAMAKPEITAWPAPQTLKPGDAKTIEGTTIEYLQATHKGPFGGMGAQFGAKVRLTTDGADGERHQYLAEPSVTLTEQGLQPSIEQIGPDYKIAMLGGMDASDKSVQLLLFFSPPIYPITVFYKPLTCLVWLGAGVMTIGGLLSAWSRRRTSPKPQVEA
jgi:cytochrome c-type biogenesis protein CcmF